MNSDPINPSHYKHLPVEAIDIIEAAIAKAPSNEAAYSSHCYPTFDR